MEQTNRISLDIDDNSVNRVQVYRSSSGKGVHVVITLTKPLSYYQSFLQRLYCGDDIKRLNASLRDLERGFNPDILYTHKKNGSKWQKRRVILDFSPPQTLKKRKDVVPICNFTNVRNAEGTSIPQASARTPKHMAKSFKETTTKNFTNSLTPQQSQTTRTKSHQKEDDRQHSKRATLLTKWKHLKQILKKAKKTLTTTEARLLVQQEQKILTDNLALVEAPRNQRRKSL